MGLALNYGGSKTNDNSATATQGSTKLVFDPTLWANLLGASNNLKATQSDQTYSEGNAVNSATAAAHFALQSILTQQEPGIDSQAKVAGGYNSTVQQNQQDLLAGTAAAASAKLIMDNITNFASIQQGNVNAASNAETAAAATAKGTATVDTTGATQSNGNKTTQGGSAGTTGSGSVTVICTELHRRNDISTEVYLADGDYAFTRLSPHIRAGYLLWARPLVTAMRRHHLVYKAIKFFGVKWANHMAAVMSPDLGYKSITGYLLLLLGVPVCYFLGLFISSKGTPSCQI